MAVLDFTLNKLKLPGLANYTPPVGTKKAANVALTTEEGCDNFTLPFVVQRPVTVSESSTCTGNVEHNALIELTASGITLTLANGAYKGVKAEIFCTAQSGSASVVCGALTYIIAAGSKTALFWDGTTWQQDGDGESDLSYKNSRWLIFDFSDANHKSIVIKKGTKIPLDITSGGTVERRWLNVVADTKYDMSTTMTTAANASSTRTGEKNGRDFYVYMVPDTTGVKLVASLKKDAPSDIDGNYSANNSRKIGQFHTLCANAGDNLTGIIPADPGSLSVGDNVLVKNVEQGSDFYNFYNRKVTTIVTNAVYDTVTVEHTLKGYLAGDILPESIWCLSFSPSCIPDGMIYDPDTNMAIDIYLQSGKGRNTASVYGGTTTRTRQQENHQADMNAVGKLLISDEEFTSAALGSNEKTNIAGSAESSIVTTGGHVDTASRRMISFLGCEDMCGTIWHWTRNVSANNGSNWSNYDGVGNFGQTYGVSNAVVAGGDWSNGASCGSRCRYSAYARSYAYSFYGARGVSRVIRGL